MKYVVVGGGIIGTTIALELARRKMGQVTLLEKESSLGQHASGRNSGVIHSGINQKPGSMKAKMCREGSDRLRAYCRERNVPMNECGTLVVATDNEAVSTLERLLEMGKECGVPELAMLTGDQLRDREPVAQGVAALLSPKGATVDSTALLNALAQDAREAGVQYHLCEELLGVNGMALRTNRGIVQADHIINCAGLYADRVAHWMGAGKAYRVIPFRGEYMELKGCDVRSMVYQAPDLRFPFLSIHLTRETDGRVLAGPSAVIAFGREAYDKQWPLGEMAEMMLSWQFLRLMTSREFLGVAMQNAATSFSKRAFLKEIQTIAPRITQGQLSPARAGIRAQLVDKKGKMVMDLTVEYQKNATHVLNVVSPGMTCSLAFAAHVVNKLS